MHHHHTHKSEHVQPLAKVCLPDSAVSCQATYACDSSYRHMPCGHSRSTIKYLRARAPTSHHSPMSHAFLYNSQASVTILKQLDHSWLTRAGRPKGADLKSMSTTMTTERLHCIPLSRYQQHAHMPKQAERQPESCKHQGHHRLVERLPSLMSPSVIHSTPQLHL